MVYLKQEDVQLQWLTRCVADVQFQHGSHPLSYDLQGSFSMTAWQYFYITTTISNSSKQYIQFATLQ